MAGLETGGPRGPSEALQVDVCVCVGGGLLLIYPLAVLKLCVFVVDLTQLLESQIQSVRPDVDRCAVYNLTSSETHIHTQTQER